MRPLAPIITMTDFIDGDKIEVKLNDGWWSAIITRVEGARVFVKFPGEGDDGVVRKRDCRAGVRWVDGNWKFLTTGEDVELFGQEGGGPDGKGGKGGKGGGGGGGALVADGNVDLCVVCHRAGNLICCDACPGAYHMACAGESKNSLPDGDWFCPECSALPVAVRSRPDLMSRNNPALRRGHRRTDVCGQLRRIVYGIPCAVLAALVL